MARGWGESYEQRMSARYLSGLGDYDKPARPTRADRDNGEDRDEPEGMDDDQCRAGEETTKPVAKQEPKPEEHKWCGMCKKCRGE